MLPWRHGGGRREKVTDKRFKTQQYVETGNSASIYGKHGVKGEAAVCRIIVSAMTHHLTRGHRKRTQSVVGSAGQSFRVLECSSFSPMQSGRCKWILQPMHGTHQRQRQQSRSADAGQLESRVESNKVQQSFGKQESVLVGSSGHSR